MAVFIISIISDNISKLKLVADAISDNSECSYPLSETTFLVYINGTQNTLHTRLCPLLLQNECKALYVQLFNKTKVFDVKDGHISIQNFDIIPPDDKVDNWIAKHISGDIIIE